MTSPTDRALKGWPFITGLIFVRRYIDGALLVSRHFCVSCQGIYISLIYPIKFELSCSGPGAAWLDVLLFPGMGGSLVLVPRNVNRPCVTGLGPRV